jgi:pyroglutamyl-peptidase
MQVRALVTGFAPYGHRGCNPAAEVALAMDGKTVAGAQVIGRTLPVAYSSLRSEIERLLAEIQPAVAISLGLWPGEPVIRIERIGVNVTDFEIPDNEGKLLVDEAIQAGGLAARLSTLPIRKIEQALLGAGIPARISSTAGTFLCNASLYTLLAAADTAENTPAACGFIHLPYLPAQVAEQLQQLRRKGELEFHQRSDFASMDLATSIRAIEIAVATSIRASA